MHTVPWRWYARRRNSGSQDGSKRLKEGGGHESKRSDDENTLLCSAGSKSGGGNGTHVERQLRIPAGGGCGKEGVRRGHRPGYLRSAWNAESNRGPSTG